MLFICGSLGAALGVLFLALSLGAHPAEAAVSISCGTSGDTLTVSVSGGAPTGDPLFIADNHHTYSIGFEGSSVCTGATYTDNTYLAVSVDDPYSPAVPVNFEPGDANGVTFSGQAGATNVIDLSGQGPGDSFVVTMNGNSTSSPGTLGGDVEDYFSNVTVVMGAPGGTTFEPSNAGSVTFEGDAVSDIANILALPASTSLLTAEINGNSSTSPGTLSGLASGQPDSFFDIGQVNGNPGSGGTTFDAGDTASSLQYGGLGSGENSLSFASISTVDSLFLNAASGVDSAVLVASGQPSGTTIATFSGISNFGACDSGTGCASTDFAPGVGATESFVGEGSSNTLDYSNVSASAGGVDVNESSGSGTATDDSAGDVSFSGVQAVLGTPSNDVFAVGTGSVDIVGEGGSDEVTLATDPAEISVQLSYGASSSNCPAASGQEVATITIGSAVDCATDITTFVGSSSGATDFVSDGYGGHIFAANGNDNTLSLSSAPHSLTSVVVDAAGNCSPLPDCVTGLDANDDTTGTGSSSQDSFSGIQAFDGAPGGGTTFQSNAAAGLSFNAEGATDDILDLSTAPVGTTVRDSGCDGTVIGRSTTSIFNGIAEFVGSSAGGTNFVASASSVIGAGQWATGSVTFTGQGQGNSLDLSDLPTSTTVAVPTSAAMGSVSVSGSTYETFQDVQSIVGSDAGGTTFANPDTGGASPVGGFTFTGQGSGNTLSFADSGLTGGVAFFLDPNGQGQEVADPGGGPDLFTDVGNIVGSGGNDEFSGGPGNYSITDSGSSNTLSYLSAPAGITVSLDAGDATVSGGYGGLTTATGVTTFVGSASGNNSFAADAYGGYSFEAPSGSSGNSLSFAGVEADTAVSGVMVAITSSTGDGTATGLSNSVTGNSSDSFQNIQSFTGSRYSDSFSVGAGSFSISDGPGNDSVSLASATSGVSFALGSAPQTVTGSGVDDSISGFETFTGSAAGGNTFSAPGEGGYDFIGGGTNNTLDWSAAPSGASVIIAGGVLQGLDAGVNGSTTDTFSSIQAFTPGISPTITSASSTSFTVGRRGTFTVTTNAYPSGPIETLSDGTATLPTGVTLVDNHNGTATLSGKPAADTGGTYTFTITAANGVGTDGTQVFTLTVITPVPAVKTVSPRSGPATGGTPIKIIGSGFVAGAKVVVGQGYPAGLHGIAATNVKVVSSTEITADTGGKAKAGKFSVFVISSGLTSLAAAGATFTYLATVKTVSPRSRVTEVAPAIPGRVAVFKRARAIQR